MSDDEIIAVVQAHKEGKQIEYCLNASNMWYPLTQSYDWGKFDSRIYRVVPEPRKPREWWVKEFPDGSIINAAGYSEFMPRPDALYIHVREVIE